MSSYGFALKALGLAFGLSLVAGQSSGDAKRIADLKRKQVDVRTQLLAVAQQIEAEEPQEKKVRDVLRSLSANEMMAALHALDTLEAAKDKAELDKAGAKLKTSQDQALETLRRLLGLMAVLDKALEVEHEEVEGGDLDDDVQQKMEDLVDKLKEFIKDQKKVIEASENLAKMNVDDFSDKDKEKLAELEAIEDKWSKFLKEAASDLSKLATQDFSNPSLLKELVETYSEIEMAKDALSKKAVEIAVPIEEAGLELAEAMTTHIEKWLPDTPDREKWQMEEPLQDVETPMAELPKELEDLVGELMEEEEDLFEDIEDASSGWTDSLDKGAGWDAMDGPISNMSAQGVTGNRLPNSSEISGRSGEGRTGKSAGEFVEESAVGKGGRQTPTRLTPDPFEKGQVKDTADEPAGGSTGGGKLAGSGGEGLEGPVPPDVQRQMKALAGRQAEIRNKAERIQLGFKVMNYPPDILNKTVEMMKQVESGLDSGRYQNITRKRNVMLENLKGMEASLKGEMRINRDRSAGLPNYLQDEIIDAMGDATPQGYEDLLKGYYQKLSEAK